MGILWAGTSSPSPNLHHSHLELEETDQSHQTLIVGIGYSREGVSL